VPLRLVPSPLPACETPTVRVCRYQPSSSASPESVHLGFFADDSIYPLQEVAQVYRRTTGQSLELPPPSDNLLDVLGPDGPGHAAAEQLGDWLASEGRETADTCRLPTSSVKLLVPVPRPNKLFLLAGNYAAHIEEGGGIAAERAETFPYVFMKPPTTTLTHPGDPIVVPGVSPNHVDWELELAVVIGRRARGVREAEALDYVAGYTIINDISDRKFRPNPQRKKREKDVFFDWLHGKWHDSFCPCGPCVATPAAIPDPQNLVMQLHVNGQIKQDASTALQIFPVAAVIEFISSFVTLEPGDMISTGTPAGVGNSTGQFLHAGDQVEASIAQIGRLVSPVVAKSA
jgi:2,4-didehydro-3-deoxy-L-rhamnonate hydrolase